MTRLLLLFGYWGFVSGGGLSSWFFGDGASNDDDDDDAMSPFLVSPLVNRELEASIVAHQWPTTLSSRYCEAWAHMSGNWKWLDAFLLSKESKDPLLDATTSPQQRALLSYALSLRAYAPTAELHRQLARHQIIESLSWSSSSTTTNDQTLGLQQVMERNAFILVNHHGQAANLNCLKESTDPLLIIEGDDHPLQDESIYVNDGNDNHDAQAILYGNIETTQFQHAYSMLKSCQFNFLVRCLGNIAFEEIGGQSTILQGYGVRLDIRNVEYKVFDDRSEGLIKDDQASLFVRADKINTTLSHAFFAGVNLSALGIQSPKLQTDLWLQHEEQQVHSQLVPPKWQRRQLALQAATVISKAPDVLTTLQDVSQNLPSVASTLVHVSIPNQFKNLAEQLEPITQQANGVALTVNGRQISVGRPSFNVFSLLRILQVEQATLDQLQLILGNYLQKKALFMVQKAWSMGQDYLTKYDKSQDDQLEEEEQSQGSGKKTNDVRIDVGRGWRNAIIYVNDVEKDAQYKSWPKNVKQALGAMRFGAPPRVRRNLFTLLGVCDPLNDGSQNAALDIGAQLLQASFPARVGYLIVNNEDLKTCQTWIESEGIVDDTIPCPINKPIIPEGQNPQMDDLGSISATTHAVHRLLSAMAKQLSGEPMLAAAVDFYIQQLSKTNSDAGGDLSLGDLVMNFGMVMEQLGVQRSQTAIQQAMGALASKEQNDANHYSYGKALRFALIRGIQSGTGFVNGRPLPNGDDAMQVWMDEQNHIFRLIATDKIKDKEPKSVYGMLLTGKNVFKKLHPLLSETESKRIKLIPEFDEKSLLFSSFPDGGAKVHVASVVNAFIDFESQKGIQFAESFISAMESQPVQDGSDKVNKLIGYRLIPTNNKSNPLCSIFAHAGLLGLDNIKTTLKLENLLEKDIDELFSSLNGDGISSEAKDAILIHKCVPLEADQGKVPLPSGNFLSVNGRTYVPSTLENIKDDVDVLLTLEKTQNKASTTMLSDILSFETARDVEATARVSHFLALQFAKGHKRNDLVDAIMSLEQSEKMESNPFRFSWNQERDEDDPKLENQISVVVDPVSEAAQRVAPLLVALRDSLQLPLRMVLAPQVVIRDDKSVPITTYYRFVADPYADFSKNPPKATFENLPTNHILTLRMDVPESWNIQQTKSIQDTDNLRCDVKSGCGDDAHDADKNDESTTPLYKRRHHTIVEYGLKNILLAGQCYDAARGNPPNGLQLTLMPKSIKSNNEGDDVNAAVVDADGTIEMNNSEEEDSAVDVPYSDSLVMRNVGYWQLQANPGVWNLNIAPQSRGAEIFDMVDGDTKNGRIVLSGTPVNNATKTIVVKDFLGRTELLLVKRRKGFEKASLFHDNKKGKTNAQQTEEVINVFSLATGHLYERFLKIMMLSVTKRTSSKVKFWLFENFLSPTFKSSARAMAKRIGCQVEFVTYKWPEWLRGQQEKQRIIWGYKILFLDVLFPLGVKKIIYVDADQVVRGDLKELWDMDLKGAPYGYTPMCSSRESTLGYQFWRGGFWEGHLRGKPYHISALYVVDLERFRRDLVGDQLRSTYQQLTADPNSLANLDQDLPNYAQHSVPIFSLPQDWLWCESWCSDETKATAKTIDLCNNPLHKEPKVSMAKRVISGPLFKESWVELDAEVQSYDDDYFNSLSSSLSR